MMKTKIKRVEAGVVFILLPPVTARAEYPVVTTEALLSLMDQKTDFLLVDTRSKEEYQEANIRGAVSIPEKQFEELHKSGALRGMERSRHAGGEVRPASPERQE